MTIAMLICAMGCSARQPIREDTAISDDVRARFAASAPASPSAVTVDTKAGVVHLTGVVATYDDRDSVERIARDTAGVQSVNNDVIFGTAPAHVKPANP